MGLEKVMTGLTGDSFDRHLNSIVWVVICNAVLGVEVCVYVLRVFIINSCVH